MKAFGVQCVELMEAITGESIAFPGSILAAVAFEKMHENVTYSPYDEARFALVERSMRRELNDAERFAVYLTVRAVPKFALVMVRDKLGTMTAHDKALLKDIVGAFKGAYNGLH